MTASVHATEALLFSILVQLIIMIGAARAMHLVFRRLGQPGVVGEIVAGLMLGPSLLGAVFPDVSVALFGATAAQPIVILSQIGLILLMFQIGSEFEFGHLKTPRNRKGVLWITVASVSVPFGLGLGIGVVSQPVLAPAIDPVTYSLFIGVALAITAVPILGRILREFGLERDSMGVVCISAAAANDVIGWVMLAAISSYAVASFSAGALGLQIGGLVAFGLALWFVGRPLADGLIKRWPIVDDRVPPTLMAIVIGLTFALGIVTYKLHIFAIFGGFACGLLFHKHAAFVGAWRSQVGQFVLVFFLPIFFTFTGLRTNVLGLGLEDMGWLALILAAAILGKVIPVWIAARASGFTGPQALVMGSLMNTRALMELIVLNIGYDLGFLPQDVFTMLVIMAVVTTVMTGPLLVWLLPKTGHGVARRVEA